MTQTNFGMVTDLNNIVGNAATGNWEDAAKQLRLIQEEVNEMAEAVAAKNLEALRDSIGDTLVTTYGMAHRMDIDADSDMVIIQDSNLSKFDTTLDAAEQSRVKYTEQDIETYIYTTTAIVKGVETDLFIIKSAKEQLDHNGNTIPKGKFLKADKFCDPVLTADADEQRRTELEQRPVEHREITVGTLRAAARVASKGKWPEAYDMVRYASKLCRGWIVDGLSHERYVASAFHRDQVAKIDKVMCESGYLDKKVPYSIMTTPRTQASLSDPTTEYTEMMYAAVCTADTQYNGVTLLRGVILYDYRVRLDLPLPLLITPVCGL